MLYLLLLIRMLFLKYEEFFMGICFSINGIKIKGKIIIKRDVMIYLFVVL